MLAGAACGKQYRGKQDGASMPESESGSGLGDRRMMARLRNTSDLDPVKENYKPNRNRAVCCSYEQGT